MLGGRHGCKEQLMPWPSLTRNHARLCINAILPRMELQKLLSMPYCGTVLLARKQSVAANRSCAPVLRKATAQESAMELRATGKPVHV